MQIETRDQLMEYMPKNMIWAEIGVFKGEFSQVILDKAEPKFLHLVDPWEGRWCSGGRNGDYDEWIEDLGEEFKKLQLKFGFDDRVILWREKSDAFWMECRKNLPIRVLDAVYIDALHEYENVKSDLNQAKLVTKEFILGHDYNRIRFPGCCKAVDEFCLENNLKVTHLTEDGCPTFLIPLH